MSAPVPLDAAELLANEDFVRRLARRLARDGPGADDLVQDTWLTALERGPADRSGLRAWLGRVLRNRAALQARGAARRRRREAARARPAEVPGTDELVERIELGQRLVAAVLALPAAQREVVVHRYFRGEPLVALARRLGVPEPTVRARLRRALARLRAGMHDGHDGESAFPGAALAQLGAGAVTAAPRRALEAAQVAAEVLMKKTLVQTPLLVGGVLGAGLGFGGGLLVEGHGAPAEDAARAPALLHAPATLPATDAAGGPGPPGHAAAPPSARLPVEGPGAPARTPGADGVPDDRALDPRLLLASDDRLDQVRAIRLLAEEDSRASAALLLEAFLASTGDAVLAGLLEEALLEARFDVTGQLIDAFHAAHDAEAIERIAGLLGALGARRPAGETRVVDALVAALRGAGAHGAVARNALIALGPAVLGPLEALLVDPTLEPRVAREAAQVLAGLAPEHFEEVRERLGASLAEALALAGDPGLRAEGRRAVREQTQALAMAATKRPSAEHDHLAALLREALEGTRDPQQAGYLAWGVANLRGASDAARLRTARSLLEALDGAPDDALRQHYVWAVSHLAVFYGERPVDANFFAILELAESMRAAAGGRPEVATRLDWLLQQLHAHLRND